MEISFKDLHLIEPLLQSLVDENYLKPTEIQSKAIPIALEGCDMVARAQTGTGKSAAFCLPLLQHIHNMVKNDGHHGIKGLILAPTRELATQISRSLDCYGRYTLVNHTAIYGGIPRKVQIDYLSRDIDILVATPGRLLDLVEKGYVNLNHISHFVLDEADSMLNLGFLTDVEKIINLLPDNKQMMLFSATIPYEITNLINKILERPIQINASIKKIATDSIQQQLYRVSQSDKTNLLLYHLKMLNVKSAFIFVDTKQKASQIADLLTSEGFKAEAIHSDRSQRERQETLDRFKNHAINLLVATDVVARGIDVENVSHVFNFELPQECDNYIHRIGRTGRAGNEGVAITYCEPANIKKLRNIERHIKQQMPVIDTHPYMSLALIQKFMQRDNNTASCSKNKRKKK